MLPTAEDLPAVFVQHAADVLADTDLGLSGPAIVRATAAYAIEYGVSVPHPTYPFQAANKRTAFFENVMAFSPSQRYRILKELCEHPSLGEVSSAKRLDLKVKLVSRYGHLDPGDASSDIDIRLLDETKHWLGGFPDALSLYEQALEKHRHGSFNRNLLDDLRLGLESRA